MPTPDQFGMAYEALQRCVDAHYYKTHPFHSPIWDDATIALREIKSGIAALQASIVELENAICNSLGGEHYLDMPDGGSVAILDQLDRMAQDAARYRYIFNGCTVLLPDGTECEDQQQLDAAMQKEKTT